MFLIMKVYKFFYCDRGYLNLEKKSSIDQLDSIFCNQTTNRSKISQGTERLNCDETVLIPPFQEPGPFTVVLIQICDKKRHGNLLEKKTLISRAEALSCFHSALILFL